MDFRHFFDNKKAVSPVIGVVLMVAITVILAAAIGSSVFGEGTSDPAPQANLKLTANGTEVTVDATGLGTFEVGEIGSVSATVSSGDSVNFKVIDIATRQLICGKEVRF